MVQLIDGFSVMVSHGAQFSIAIVSKQVEFFGYQFPQQFALAAVIRRKGLVACTAGNAQYGFVPTPGLIRPDIGQKLFRRIPYGLHQVVFLQDAQPNSPILWNLGLGYAALPLRVHMA